MLLWPILFDCLAELESLVHVTYPCLQSKCQHAGSAVVAALHAAVYGVLLECSLHETDCKYEMTFTPPVSARKLPATVLPQLAHVAELAALPVYSPAPV